MAQGDHRLLAQARALEEEARRFYAAARLATQDELLAATLHFLETQHALALHQLDDEALRLAVPADSPPASP